ncbi:hypothetical protein [Corynebacterium sp.]|uniref:hypothetical protein n=1 Tax=Corynebacterium sp. TaxID=1720 RepID=UPI00373655C3
MNDSLVLAIVDKSEDCTVIWRVETTPGFAALSGAWDTNDAEQVALLTTDAHVIDAAAEDPLGQVRKNMKEAGAPSVPTGEKQLAFTGEPQARRAWEVAVQAAELVEYWNAAAVQRKVKGDVDYAPLPVDAAAATATS